VGGDGRGEGSPVSDLSPGWYKDPADPDVQRYWDGEGWLGDPIPAGAVPPSGPPKDAKPDWTPKPKPPVEADDQPPASGPSSPPSTVVHAPPGAPAGQPPGWPSGVQLPPGTVLPPGAIPLPPGAPVPPGLFPGDKLPPGAIPVLLPGPAPVRIVSIVPAALAHGLPVAPMWARFIARLIDILVVLGLNIVVNGWFAYQYWKEIYPEMAAAFHATMANQKVEPLTASSRLSYLEIVIIVLAAALWFAYEVPSIAGSGQTLGKRVMRVKVMRQESTEPVGFGRAIRRWNPLGLPTLMWYCGIGFLFQIADGLSPLFDWPLRRALHDRSAGTVVVRVPRAEENAAQSVKSGETNDSVNSG
jgi:uncharacterized RDD family membrane protein YckC